MASAKQQPKRKCCTSKPRCRRCPIRMLAAGTLPAGYTVRKRRLVKDQKAAKKANGDKGKRTVGLPDAA